MIVVIDNYDSFTYNLVDYLGRLTSTDIQVFRNDKISVKGVKSLKPTCIVISPGPKTPKEAGISKDVIKTLGPDIPILGVCLGHQAIGEVFKSKITNAKQLMHGKTSEIKHSNHRLFKGIDSPFIAARYHSLVIDPNNVSSHLEVIARSVDDHEIMGVRHKKYPIYGVQFHPESICTGVGLRLLKNFLSLV